MIPSLEIDFVKLLDAIKNPEAPLMSLVVGGLMKFPIWISILLGPLGPSYNLSETSLEYTAQLTIEMPGVYYTLY